MIPPIERGGKPLGMVRSDAATLTLANPPSTWNGPIAGLLAHMDRVCLGIVFVGIIVLVCALGLGPSAVSVPRRHIAAGRYSVALHGNTAPARRHGPVYGFLLGGLTPAGRRESERLAKMRKRALSKIWQVKRRAVRKLAHLADSLDSCGDQRILEALGKLDLTKRRVVRKLWRWFKVGHYAQPL
jgi:hypothetical protein